MEIAHGVNVCVKGLDKFVNVKVVVNGSLAILSLGRLREELGHPNSWKPGEPPHVTNDRWSDT